MALGIWSGPSPCDCTQCHPYHFLDCSKKIWNLTLHSLIPVWITVNPTEYYQNLKIHVRAQSVSLFTSHQDTPKHWCFKVLCLCLNVGMIRNHTEISGTLSTDRNIFCNSFLNVIPNPCCLHTFSFPITIKDNFSCWQMPCNITQQSLFWKLVSQNSQSSLRALSHIIKKPFQTEVSFL